MSQTIDIQYITYLASRFHLFLKRYTIYLYCLHAYFSGHVRETQLVVDFMCFEVSVSFMPVLWLTVLVLFRYLGALFNSETIEERFITSKRLVMSKIESCTCMFNCS